MVPVKTFTFLKNVNRVMNGEPMDNLYKGDLTLVATGDFIATAKIQGYLGGAWHNLRVVNIEDMLVADVINRKGVYAVVCADGFEQIRAIVSACSYGSITIVGRFAYGG